MMMKEVMSGELKIGCVGEICYGMEYLHLSSSHSSFSSTFKQLTSHKNNNNDKDWCSVSHSVSLPSSHLHSINNNHTPHQFTLHPPQSSHIIIHKDKEWEVSHHINTSFHQHKAHSTPLVPLTTNPLPQTQPLAFSTTTRRDN
jgi:hypothetical protein